MLELCEVFLLGGEGGRKKKSWGGGDLYWLKVEMRYWRTFLKVWAHRAAENWKMQMASEEGG